MKGLEEDSSREDIAIRAKLLIDSLDRLETEYKFNHLKVIDLINEDDERALQRELGLLIIFHQWMLTMTFLLLNCTVRS